MPQLHHVGLNSVDPERAIDWYLRVWPSAKRTEIAGQPAVAADMLLLFNKVDKPPAGAWRHDLHRSEPQSAFWHIGAFTNTTDMASRLQAVGITHLPLFTSLQDTRGVWRSGLTPDAGTLRAKQLDTARAAPPGDGVKVVEGPYVFGHSRAVMIEDLDGLAIELIDGRVGTTRFPQQ